jgi:thiamine-phosphate pyrophosphorylase
VLETVEVACLRLPPAPAVAELVRLAQAHGTAVVLDGNPEMAAQLAADGVHLTDFRDYTDARNRLGADAIIGVHCDRSRHQAMEAGEAGADYISFAADLDLVRWWAELMVVPVVAELEAVDQAADFIAAGAEFISLGGDFWSESAALVAGRIRSLLE